MAPVDYEAVLADLRARRDKLNTAIAAIEELAGVVGAASSSDEAGGGAGLEKPAPRELRSDTFFGMGAGEAAKKYLGIAKRPATVKEIHDALLAGGLITTAKSFYSNLYTAIRRSGEIVKVPGGKWGLAEWYQGRRFDQPRPSGKRPNGAGGEEPEPSEATNASEPPAEQSPDGAPE